MKTRLSSNGIRPWAAGFSQTDALVALALLVVLAGVALPLLQRGRERSRQAVCENNLGRVARAVLQYAEQHQQRLPVMVHAKPPGGWWWYKDQVKTYAGVNGASSPGDKVFACPSDRGYEGLSEEAKPFCKSSKHNYNSYVFNGVNLPGLPNIAGRIVSNITGPSRTLLVMEWTAHAPLSWHKSRTGRANAPFYNNAESVVAFVDGHVKMVKIYYDGINPAYTRDPIPGYEYKYSGD